MQLSSFRHTSETLGLIDLRDRLQSCLDDFDRHPILSSHALAAQLDLVISRLENLINSSIVDDNQDLHKPH